MRVKVSTLVGMHCHADAAIAYHHDMAPARLGQIRTDIARDNAAVLGIGFGLTVSVMVTVALVALVIDGVVFAHGEAPASLAPFVHRFLAHGGALALARFAGFVLLGLVAVMLESLVLARRVFAADLVETTTEALAVVRSVFVARLLDALGAGRPVPRRFLLVCHEAENGILHQLRCALSLSPAAPPRSCFLAASPSGSLSPSSHRVEVDPAA